VGKQCHWWESIQIDSPEEINQGIETAPSKRIKAILPEYDKKIAGSLIALEVGLKKLCDENQEFKEWIEIEKLKTILD